MLFRLSTHSLWTYRHLSPYDDRVNRRKENELKVAFGRAVRRFRLSRKFSQEELADLADIHRTYIGDVERGTRNISLVNMCRIAHALEVPLSRIISDMEQNA